jgi:hypothetical protein
MSTTFGFVGSSDSAGQWFASTVKYAGSGCQARGNLGQLDHLGEWFSGAISYNGSPVMERPWMGQNDSTGSFIEDASAEGIFMGSATQAVGAVIITTYLPVSAIEEMPMWTLQGDAGGHPRPYDGSDVSAHPGNTVTVYYNDIHERAGPDSTLTAAFNSPAGAFIFISGDGTLPAQYRGLHQVTAIGADKPYHDTEDTHNWLQFICGGAPAGLWGSYGTYYRQVTFSVSGVSISPNGVVTYPPGVYFRDGFRGMTWMKNVVTMTRDFWDKSLGTPYSGQLFPHGGNSPSPGQVFPY